MINLTKKNIKIFYESLDNSSPINLIKNRIYYDNSNLYINNKKINIIKKKCFYIISFGKASQKMFLGINEVLGKKKLIDDYLVISHQKLKTNKIDKSKFYLSTHPLASNLSYKSALRLLAFIRKIPTNSNVIMLISGGGSSMLAHPIDGLQFKKKSDFINLLINQGIGEREVNYFRKILSSIKSGKLIKHFIKSKIFNIIWSDERTNKIDAISSGITVPQNNYKINSKLLKIVFNKSFCTPLLKNVILKHNHLVKKNLFGNKVSNYIIADRIALVNELIKNLHNNRFNDIKYGNHIYEETYLEALDKIKISISKFYDAQLSGYNALILTGEIPVKANKNTKGGRNQHLAASLIDFLKDFKNFSLCCFATDGCDYIKGIHGAYIDDSIIQLINDKKIDYTKYLINTSTYFLHKKMNSFLKGDYTGNNFSDFYVFIYKV